MSRLPFRFPAALMFVAFVLAAAASPAAAEPQWHRVREPVVIFLGVGLLYACVLPMAVLLTFLAPEVTRRAAAAVVAGPVRSFLVGVGAVVVLAILGKASEKIRPLQLVSVPLLVLLVVGGAGTAAEDLGRRACALAGREGSRLTRILAGWAVLAAAGVVPMLGWFLVGPALVTLGMGGFVRALVTRAPEDAAAAPAASRTAPAATALGTGDPPPAPSAPPA